MEGGVGPRLLEGLLEIEAGRHQRLGHEASAEVAEAPVGTGFSSSGSSSRIPPVVGLVVARSGDERVTGVDFAVAAARALTMNVAHLQWILAPGDGLDPGGDVDAERAQVGDGLGDVVRAQAAGDDEPAGVGHALGQPPVEDLARPGVVAVDQQVVGPELGEAADGPIAGRETP